MASRMELVSPKSPSAVRDCGDKQSGGAIVFTSHVRRTFQRHPKDYTGELVRLLDDLANFTNVVASAVADSSLVPEYTGHNDSAAFDVSAEGATVALYRLLASDGYCCIILSKGNNQPLTFPEGVPHGNYVVCVSPLDCDSVAGVGGGAGTLFSIYKRRSSASLPGRGIDLKQKLANQVAAGYCNYSSANTLHYTMGHGVYSFVMHPVAAQYFLQPAAPLVIPDNEGLVYCDRQIMLGDSELATKARGLLSGDRFKITSAGCLVSDVYLLLRSGGVLIAKDVHLLCEAAAIAYIIEEAGGVAIDQFGDRILDMTINMDHDIVVTLVAGSKPAVSSVGQALLAPLNGKTNGTH